MWWMSTSTPHAAQIRICCWLSRSITCPSLCTLCSLAHLACITFASFRFHKRENFQHRTFSVSAFNPVLFIPNSSPAFYDELLSGSSAIHFGDSMVRFTKALCVLVDMRVYDHVYYTTSYSNFDRIHTTCHGFSLRLLRSCQKNDGCWWSKIDITCLTCIGSLVGAAPKKTHLACVASAAHLI